MLVGAATIFAVRDIAASTTFYRDGLGFAVSFEYGNPTFYVCLCRDDVQLHLVTEGIAKRQAGESALSIFVMNVDTIYAEFMGRGISTIKPPADYDYGMREFDLLDPDGNRLIFGKATQSHA